ncbi:MAG: hypothetical protein AMS14_07415 [Planctomycetes bacterium DG_20]|nr:MAG: hypothetical protein AMS14_07415 [Planctomycetes bacterium DG_20]
MRNVLRFSLVGLFLVIGTGGAYAEGVPWKTDEAAKQDAPAATGDLKAELPPAQYNRVVKPIEAKIEAAEKIMEAYEKEMEKPAEKRNERLLLGCKTRAAEAYLGAAMAATKGIGMVKEDSHKAALKQQYEEPNRKKAIDMFLELAVAAYDKGDLRTAVAYYKRVLSVDKENADAKEGLVKIARQVKEAAESGKKTGSKGGGSDDQRPWDRDYSRPDLGGKDWSGMRRGGW